MFTTNKHKIQQIHICLQQINIRCNKYTKMTTIKCNIINTILLHKTFHAKEHTTLATCHNAVR